MQRQFGVHVVSFCKSLSSRIWCLHVMLAGVKDTQQRSYKNWADVFTLFDGTKRSEKLTKLQKDLEDMFVSLFPPIYAHNLERMVVHVNEKKLDVKHVQLRIRSCMGVVYFCSCKETIFSTFEVQMKPRRGFYYFFQLHIY